MKLSLKCEARAVGSARSTRRRQGFGEVRRSICEGDVSGQRASLRHRHVRRRSTWRARTSVGAKRSDRRDSEGRDSAVPKPGPERYRSASALFRPKRSRGFVAEPMFYRPTANPSRRRTVSPPAEGLVFHGPKRSAEPTAWLRRCWTRASHGSPGQPASLLHRAMLEDLNRV